MNYIDQEQNKEDKLKLLAAQRQLYTDSKKLQLISVIISIPIVIILSGLVAIFPKLAAYAALYGTIATILEAVFLSRLQKNTQEKAARIQQVFDCEVLKFDWNSLNCGNKIEPETVINYSEKYKHRDPNYDSIKNWYPISIRQLAIEQARIICQRSNVWWDANLRRRYSNWVLFVLGMLVAIVLLMSLIGGLTLEKFVLAVVVPLTPAFVFGLRQCIDHRDSADRLDRLRESADAVIQEVIDQRLTPQDIQKESYSLQMQIYENRRYNPLIFDWIYSRLRDKNEEQMNKGAESLIQELTQSP